MHRKSSQNEVRENVRTARRLWPDISKIVQKNLEQITEDHHVSVICGDLLLLNGSWYVTTSGLFRIAKRAKCAGIHVQPVPKLCDRSGQRWTFKATVYKSRACKGFVGYGDADPSNVSPLVHGAEMRVAETRAVNRALRKAYGIGICSVEEIGVATRKAPQPANGNGNFGGRTVRDRLCQLIRQHQLDATAVKSYATEFCGVKALRDATREQVEKFVAHLAEQADKDRSA
jgi:hypothetical protein